MDTGLNTKKLSLRNRRARRNLALKLSLEKRFVPELKAYFNIIRKRVISEYLKSGDILTGSTFVFLTTELLSKHYRRVAKSFNNEMRLFINSEKSFTDFEKKQSDEDIEEETQNSINVINAIQIMELSSKRSFIIDSTTGAEIAAAFQFANTEAATQPGVSTATNIAKNANDKLKDSFKGRVSSIVLTETQVMAESAKFTEAAVISRKGQINHLLISTGEVIGNPGATKEWSSVLIQSTREAHMLADGQVQNINDPFIVGGELIPIPGDGSLGASPGNLINCYCSALYSV